MKTAIRLVVSLTFVGLLGLPAQAQSIFAGLRVGAGMGAPFLGGVQGGALFSGGLGARVSISNDFRTEFALIDTEALFTFADDGTWRGYAGVGASFLASYNPLLTGIVLAGAEYRFDSFGVFGEVRARAPVDYIGAAPIAELGFNYHF